MAGAHLPCLEARLPRACVIDLFKPCLVERLWQYPDLNTERPLREILAIRHKRAQRAVADCICATKPPRKMRFAVGFQTP